MIHNASCTSFQNTSCLFAVVTAKSSNDGEKSKQKGRKRKRPQQKGRPKEGGRSEKPPKKRQKREGTRITVDY